MHQAKHLRFESREMRCTVSMISVLRVARFRNTRRTMRYLLAPVLEAFPMFKVSPACQGHTTSAFLHFPITCRQCKI